MSSVHVRFLHFSLFHLPHLQKELLIELRVARTFPPMLYTSWPVDSVQH
uniref:Uncharacterized protein n=1 Tax=Physcomitrium patens TaxID=3218 RepID=A0A2K1IUQ4_PHYPA|nr:hypothetical protein PHYPA_024949 [Physcomitrium patens]